MQGETSQEKGNKQWWDCNTYSKTELNAVIFMPSPQEQQDTCQDYILQCFAFKQQFSQWVNTAHKMRNPVWQL